MHWVLQSNIFNEDGHEKLIETLTRFDIPFSEHKVIPFIGEIEPDISPMGKVICMGSYSMRHLAKKKGWYPGVFDLGYQDFRIQLKFWRTKMLNWNSTVIEFQNVEFPPDLQQMFIRPIDDTKVFAGKIFNREEFADWQKRVCDLKLDDGSDLHAGTLVQMCVPRVIFTEYRFWVVKGKIVTSSLYKQGTVVRYEEGAPDFITKFAAECIAEWQPHDAFVIDIADTINGPKIVEINTLNSSGYYAADIQKLVFALEVAFGGV